ncbi:MAG: class I adenylate-forming enzyme family protein [Betaproteobacteria bacterium]
MSDASTQEVSLLQPLEVLRRFAPHDFSIAAFFQRRCAALGDAPMLEYQDQVLSWRECARRVDQAVGWLKTRGIGKGDRIGLMAYTHPGTVVLMMACARLGAIIVPSNPEFEVRDSRYVFEHAGVSGVVCSPEALGRVRDATAAIRPMPWVLMYDDPSREEAPLAEQWQQAQPDTTTYDGKADDTTLILYTSGTTGFPKGVMHSQRSYLLTAEAFVLRMYLQPGERVMCVLPLFHINALMYSLGGSIACGGTLILIRKFSAASFWRDAARYRATEVNVIMSAAAILSRRPIEEFDASHCLAKMFLAPLNQDLLDTFTHRFHVPVLIECYGMTEIPGVLSNPFLGPRKLGSMGRISPHPDPAIERPQVRILDEQGRDCAVGDIGEIAVRTPTLMQGYYRDPEQTQASFQDGWFLTGDLGWHDDDDFFFFYTRRKDVIRRRGENISGAEIDTVVGSHPDVLECAAVGVPSDLGEEEVLVAIVARSGSSLDLPALYAYACERLAPLKRPRYLVSVDSLPHTGSMKIAKFRLKPDLKDLMARATDFSPSSLP